MKKLPILSVAFLLGLGVTAAPLSPQEALQRAQQDAPRALKSFNKSAPQLLHTRLTPENQAALYVFGSKGENGFMIVSADDCTRPLLGYSDSGVFDTSNMSPEFEWWLNEYAAQIAYATARSSANTFSMPKKKAEEPRQAIAPMIKTKWDQIDPFNELCPLSGTTRTYTGCVATAMAQVMTYWQYPERGAGSITYSVETLEKKVSMNFENKPFEWDKMKTSYLPGSYTPEEAEAVAYLMKACGYAVKMQYSTDASGALAMNIPNAFTKYLRYDPNIFYTLRSFHSAEEWDNMMYENLRDVGPVLLGGSSTFGGGHSFICDGYDGNGYYHFNWGWSGMSDGYFALDALNPDALGTGGGTGGGYNFSQDAVFKLQPPTGAPAEPQPLFLTQTGGLEGAIEGSTLTFALNGDADPMWVNYTPVTLKIKMGVEITNLADTEAPTIYHDISSQRFQIIPGYGTGPQYMEASLDLAALNLPDGTYSLTAGSCQITGSDPTEATDGTGFQPVKPFYGFSNSIVLTIKDGAYSVTNSYKPQLKVKAEITSPLYYGCLMSLKVTATNDSDIELSSGFAPAFAGNEGLLFLGESISVSVAPHSSVTKEWTTSLEQLQQIYVFDQPKPLLFTLFDEETFSFYTDQITLNTQMQPNPGTPKLTCSTPLALPGTIRETFHEDGTRFARYIVTDPLNIKVTAGLTLTSGYFHYPMLACLCVPYDSEQVEITLTSAKPILLSEPGQTADFETTLGYPLYDPDMTYYMILAYASPAGAIPVANPLLFRIDETAGVAEITETEGLFIIHNRESGLISAVSDSEIVSLEAYDISGAPIAAEKSFLGNTATLSTGAQGIILVTATDAGGNTRTSKIVR